MQIMQTIEIFDYRENGQKGGKLVINKADFDPDKHRLFSDQPPPPKPIATQAKAKPKRQHGGSNAPSA